MQFMYYAVDAIHPFIHPVNVAHTSSPNSERNVILGIEEDAVITMLRVMFNPSLSGNTCAASANITLSAKTHQSQVCALSD